MDNNDSDPVGYRLEPTAPGVDAYLELRTRSGLTPRRRDQAEAALDGGWLAAHVVQQSTGDTVAMGRVIGDGGWYFHIVDIAVLPEHQRRGIGDRVLGHLVAVIRAAAPPGAYISLLADPPGRRLYARHGFTDSAPGSVGMVLTP